MSDTRVYNNPMEVMTDYLKDIRDELRAMNKKLDALTGNDGNLYIRTLDKHEG